MGFLGTWLTVGGVILSLMITLWLLSLVLRDASIVDIFWGTGFVIAAWVALALAPDKSLPRPWLLVGLATVWGLRLSLHLLRRNWGRPEDFRYAEWRRQNGARWWWFSLFQVFLLQGVLMWIVSAPLIVGRGVGSAATLNWLDGLGLAVWLVGFFFEAVGDWQLARFKADPANRGKLLDSGVWRYTRHPNYFGDAAQWWGFFLIAAAAGRAFTIFSPLVMTFLLVRVSGVGMLEKTLKDSKPGYREYIRRTSAFVPWFPRPAQVESPQGGGS